MERENETATDRAVDRLKKQRHKNIFGDAVGAIPSSSITGANYYVSYASPASYTSANTITEWSTQTS